jgi:hypothetical protein
MAICDSYPDGVCPDCQEPISTTTENGFDCKNCGHVFWEDIEEYHDDKDTCIFLGDHLTDCDGDGFCNYCGEQ